MNGFEEIKSLLHDSNFYYVITAGMDGTYGYVNNRYKRVFDNIHGSIVGKPYYITMHPDDLKICESTSIKCFENPGSVFPATIRKHDGNGGYIITQWEYSAMWNDDGTPGGIFCMGHDVTEFMNTSILLQNTLQQVDRQKDALEEIAFNQSHVIRRPLANILGLSLVLENMDRDPNLKSICQLLVESAHELDVVIKDTINKTAN